VLDHPRESAFVYSLTAPDDTGAGVNGERLSGERRRIGDERRFAARNPSSARALSRALMRRKEIEARALLLMDLGVTNRVKILTQRRGDARAPRMTLCSSLISDPYF